MGPSTDTLTFVITLGDSLNIPLDPSELLSARGFLQASFTVTGNTGTYNHFSIPITDNMNGIAADSVLVWLIATGEEAQVGAAEESFFLIDNMYFGEVSGNYTPELEASVKVYPVPFDDHITLDNNNEALEAKIYDLNGRLIKSFSLQQGISEHSMNEISISGNYILDLYNPNKNQRSSYNIIKK